MALENIIRAEARKYDDVYNTLPVGHVRYDVFYYTDTDLENMFTVHVGEPSKRWWNHAQQIARKLTK